MYNLIHTILSNFTITFFVVGIICSLVAIRRQGNHPSKEFIVETFFKYYCFWACGICWVYNGIIHVVYHKMAAGFIGWADSPFQIEVGVASLGFGIVGLLALRKNFGLRMALIISTSVFLWGCAIGHIYQMSATGNHAAGNAGVMLYSGLLMPVIGITLLCLSYITSKPKLAI